MTVLLIPFNTILAFPKRSVEYTVTVFLSMEHSMDLCSSLEIVSSYLNSSRSSRLLRNQNHI